MVVKYDRYLSHFVKFARPHQYNQWMAQDMTALSFACHAGLLNKVECLLHDERHNSHVDVNARGLYGHTPIFHAVWSGNTAVVKVLGARSDVEWNCCDTEERPLVLLQAIHDLDLNMVGLLAQFPALDWSIKANGFPVLQINFMWRQDAILSGNVKEAEERLKLFNVLLNNNNNNRTLDWNQQNKRGERLVGLALERQDVDVFILLCKIPQLIMNPEETLAQHPTLTKQSLKRCMRKLEQEQTLTGMNFTDNHQFVKTLYAGAASAASALTDKTKKTKKKTNKK